MRPIPGPVPFPFSFPGEVREMDTDTSGGAPAPKSEKRARRRPSMATMERWIDEGVAKALDGCSVEPDGTCEHGSPSWLLAMGLI